MISVSILMILISGPGIVRMLLSFACWGVILKYSFAALKNTAKGSFVPPKITLDTISSEFDIVFKQLFVYLIIGFIFYRLIQGWGSILAIPFLLFALLSIPAIMIVLVCTNSLISSINPLIFVRMAWRIGWGYLLMYLFLMFLGGAPAALAGSVIVYLPVQLQQFLYPIAKSYYTIVAYHLMGYVIFQYHEEIGYDVDFDDEGAASKESEDAGDEGNALLKKVNIFIKDGNIDDAIALMENEPDDVSSDIRLAECYYNLLALKQRTPEMVNQGIVYLDLLSKEGVTEKLFEVYSECLSKDADFAPPPSSAFKIANAMIKHGNPKGAVGVYQRFIRTNPKSPLIPKAYFLAANVINNDLHNPQKAVEILRGIIRKYPDHEILPYVRKYLGEINA
jgi:tetratricopeptide (TPR) repeat protein